MKILIVNTSDIVGGAARAAYRLHQALLMQGIDSKMLVQSKKSDDWTVGTVGSGKIQKAINMLRPTIESLPTKLYKTKTLFSPSWLGFNGVVDKINKLNPDVVHLHWICGGMLKIGDLEKIKAPIVWSLHDMWAFTGGCHYDEYCGKYESECGGCPVLDSHKKNDLSRKTFKIKQKTYQKIKDMTVIGTSNWIADCAKKSTLFRNKKIVSLPNCFDTDLFKKLDADVCKEIFKIPKDKKVILFGAMNPLGDPRKGAKELFKAIDKVEVKDTIFVVAGSSKPENPINIKYPTYFILPLFDEISLPFLYNIADVMIVPSLQENLANSIIESLACGVPVVAFDIGGNGDMIEHKVNGYLAKKSDNDDLKNGIEWVLNNKGYEELSNNARNKALKNFDAKIVPNKYIKLYKNIIKERNGSR